MNELIVCGMSYVLKERVEYPNGGSSSFYVSDNTAIIIDKDICSITDSIFAYSLITEKQNSYMNIYDRVFRFLFEDLDSIDSVLNASFEHDIKSGFDRVDSLDASPLEFLFENCFANVYGMDSLKYLYKEYGITDWQGNNYFLDYVVQTNNGNIGIEENGIHYHHPQLIGIDRYRKQLMKQNTCTLYGIKLYRFSTEDCQFMDRIEDDIKLFFGNSVDNFIVNGLSVQRKFKLYEHQKITLDEIKKRREEGIHTFLIHLPTASGKSKIIEEDLKEYPKDNNFKALIMAPNKMIVEDWKKRIHASLPELVNQIDIKTDAYIMLHYQEYRKDEYNYIVFDEAHHAVAPVTKRMIQYFTPEFLIGLTATDQRLDHKKLESVFGNYNSNLSLEEAMEKKVIAEANVYRIETNIDLSKVRFNEKDYVNADLEKNIRVTSRNELIADVINEYFTEGEMSNKQGLVFCVNIEHTKEMAKILNDRGISAASYTSKTKDPQKVMDDFNNKKIRFLCACSMISEGWDFPELGILVMARPTLSKVLYLQQIGRGLRRTSTKSNVFVIDVVDEYGAMARPCSMHSIFHNDMYVPFGSITNRSYSIGDFITIDGLVERVERIIKVDIHDFEELYGDHLNQEQLAREFFMNTGSINSWIRKKKIIPDHSIQFGSRKIYLFSPKNVERIRMENNIKIHNDETIKEDFFDFLHERDYSLSYKMPFMLSLLKNMSSIGECEIEDILDGYIEFYLDRINKGLPVDRAACKYDKKTLADRKEIKRSILTNPFEKFERKRFMYYSKDLNKIAFNHSLFDKLTDEDIQSIKNQMEEDLVKYYKKV